MEVYPFNSWDWVILYFFNHFIFNEIDNNDTNIIQYFIMHGLGLCIKLNRFVVNMLYSCSFSNNKPVPIAINKKNYSISLNEYTTAFDWGDEN